MTVAGHESVRSPFSSSEGGVECVTELLREGRCVQTNTLNSFVYVTIYSFLKFWVLLELYHERVAGFSQAQLVWLDIAIVTPFAVFR